MLSDPTGRFGNRKPHLRLRSWLEFLHMGSPPYLCHSPGWCIFCVWACSRRDSLSCVPVFLHSSKLCLIILVEVGASLVIPENCSLPGEQNRAL